MKNQVQQTTDYDLFKDHLSNREVDPRHVKQLTNSIRKKNMLHLKPILVDKDHAVIDGQHRLAAAKKLELPIFYVVDTAISKKDIASLNSNQKNWSPLDYVNYFTVEGAPNYSNLSLFISKHPYFSVNAALSLVGENHGSDYKNGEIDISRLEQAERIAQQLDWFVERYDFAKSRSFAQALSRIFRHEEYDPDQMVRKVEQQPRSVVPCINASQYTSMLLDIYNYRNQRKISV